MKCSYVQIQYALIRLVDLSLDDDADSDDDEDADEREPELGPSERYDDEEDREPDDFVLVADEEEVVFAPFKSLSLFDEDLSLSETECRFGELLSYLARWW